MADQQTYNVTGTTEVFGSFRKDIRQVPGVSCLQWMPDLYHLGGPCQTGLATLAWFGRTFLNDDNPASVMDCAALAKPDLPLCLPFVSGERMPFWKPDLAAQFLEVRSQHGLPELARALLSDARVLKVGVGVRADVERLWEAVAPDPCLYPHRFVYGWLCSL